MTERQLNDVAFICIALARISSQGGRHPSQPERTFRLLTRTRAIRVHQRIANKRLAAGRDTTITRRQTLAAQFARICRIGLNPEVGPRAVRKERQATVSPVPGAHTQHDFAAYD